MSDRSASSDLTARARIRDAALALFAEHGVAGTSLRGVAQSAGVSLGLVQHHFGTKSGLREACDEHVVAMFHDRLLDLDRAEDLADPAALGDLAARSPLLLRYLARAMVEDSSAAATVFDHLADGAEQFLSIHWPSRFPPGADSTRDAAAVMTAMHNGIAILQGQIRRRLGTASEEELHGARLGMAALNLYSAIGDFADSGTGDDLRTSLESLDPGPAEGDDPHGPGA